MKTVIILAAFTALSSAFEWTDLRVRWNGSDTLHQNSFFEIPRTANSSISEGWVSVPHVNDHPVTVYCPKNDGRFCVLTDSYGNIAGIQVSVLASDIDNKGIPYDPSTIAAYKKKTLFGEDYWTTTVYTVDPNLIDAGGRRDAKGLIMTTGVWVEEGDSYMYIDKNLNTLLKTLDFRKNNCFPSMGHHYYLKLDENQDCKEISPYFLMYSGNDLTVLGFLAFGRPTTLNRPWYDALDWTAIKPTIPKPPACLVDWGREYGIITMHIFLVEKPWKITC
ncbi:uncharacterized protein LOC107273729 [Cephus cinctus]|uniref:Uncharacterized protein LOC107273729 n=1 Tax=Cephus cinctus TaxID=211228 RepID=A0AAJ7CCY3_CEPCN|nr:uncharacterized protein LOC107273729 [Cephus cinctus]